MAREPRICIRWTGTELVPAAPVDRLMLRNMEPGLLQADRWRNPEKLMMRLHAMIGRAIENSLEGNRRWTVEGVKNQCKIEQRMFETIGVSTDGEVLVRPQSLTELDREELGRFYDVCRDFCLMEVCPGVDPKLLDKEVDGDVEQSRQRRRS